MKKTVVNGIVKSLKEMIENGLITEVKEVRSFCSGAGIDTTSFSSGVHITEETGKVTLTILGRYYYYNLNK